MTLQSDAKRFAVALSFPGEHRTFVEKVANKLSEIFTESRVLYDRYCEAEFARIDLDVYLPGLYRTQSELIVLFLCPEYAQKHFCNVEWRHIRQLCRPENAQRIMLLRYGDCGDFADLGIFYGSDGSIDFSDRSPEDIAELIRERFELNNGNPRGPSPEPRPTPRAAKPTSKRWAVVAAVLLALAGGGVVASKWPPSLEVAAGFSREQAANYKVFIQFAGYERGRIQGLASQLADQGWNVQGRDKGGERLATADRLAEVRYGDDSDAAAAKALAAALDASKVPGRSVKTVHLGIVQPNVLEVWIGQ